MNTPFDQIRVETLTSEGEGIARIGDKAMFVPGALPGDLIRGEANLNQFPLRPTQFEIFELSPQRCAHPCVHHGECRGSILGGLEYQTQCEHKRQALIHTLRKLKCDQILPIVPSPQPWHYRQRLTLSVWNEDGKACIGFKTAARQEEGTAIKECALALPEIDAAVQHVAGIFDKLEYERLAMPLRVQIHRTESGAGALLMFDHLLAGGFRRDWLRVLAGEALSGGIWVGSGNKRGLQNEHSRYAPVVHAEVMCTTWLGRKVDVHPSGFCQTNHFVADLICRALKEQFSGKRFRQIWDLYGGWGMLSLSLADRDTAVTVVESSSFAQRTAETLAQEVGIRSFRFLHGFVIGVLQERAHEITADDLVILDPASSGVHNELLTLLGKSPARTIVYLSCNPARLARDAFILKQLGFVTRSVIPFDMFPQTPGMEALAVLERD